MMMSRRVPVMQRWWLWLALLMAPASFGAQPPLEIVGLYRDTAVIRSGSSNLMLRVGESTADGMTLLEATPEAAIIEYRGERYTYQLSGRAGARFSAPAEEAVIITRDRTGQYRTRGFINGQLTDLLVDTGASVITMSGVEAERLGLRVGEDAPRAEVVTAQGRTDARRISLDRVQVGSLTSYNVDAIVINGDFPREILLGMSFLSEVDLEESAGVMTLRR